MGMGRKGKRIPIFISIIYEAYVCQIETLHLNSLSSNVLHRMVKFFYLLQLFNEPYIFVPETGNLVNKRLFVCVNRCRFLYPRGYLIGSMWSEMCVSAPNRSFSFRSMAVARSWTMTRGSCPSIRT